VGDAQAVSKNAISKTRTPVSAACIITDVETSHGDRGCNQTCANDFATKEALLYIDQLCDIDAASPNVHPPNVQCLGQSGRAGRLDAVVAPLLEQPLPELFFQLRLLPH